MTLYNKTIYAVVATSLRIAVPEKETKILKIEARGDSDSPKQNESPVSETFKRAMVHFPGMYSCGDNNH